MATEFALLSPQHKGLPPDWRAGRLSDVAALNPDQITTATHFERIAYVDISCVSRGQISKPVDMPLSEAPSRARRLVRAGDTILSTVRPGNRAYAFIRSPPRNLVCSTGFVVLRARQGSADPRFIYFLTSSERVIQHLAVIAEKQTAYPSVTAKDVGECAVVIPPLPEQRAIARVLGTLDDEIVSRMGESKGLRRIFDLLMRHLLDGSWSVHEGESWLREVRPLVQAYDDKIELNRRMNQTLEEICRALFKFWFVDFGPVRAKAERRWKKGESLPGMPADMWDLWPSEFEDSEIGEIPKGWKVSRLSETCSTQYGYTASATELPLGPHLLRVTDINKAPWIDWASVPYCAIPPEDFQRYALAEGDILVARMADPGKSAIVEGRIEAVFASYLVRLKVASLARAYYIFYFLRSDSYLEYVAGARSGSVQANMNARVIVDVPCLSPPPEILGLFLAQVLPLRRRINIGLTETSTLAKTRDTLLPKLLSGEIRVRVDS